MAAALSAAGQPSGAASVGGGEGAPSAAYLNSGSVVGQCHWDPTAAALATPWPSLGPGDLLGQVVTQGSGGAAPQQQQQQQGAGGGAPLSGGATVAASGQLLQPMTAKVAARLRVRMLPYLASRSPSGHFSITKSNFKIRKAKMSAARVVVNR